MPTGNENARAENHLSGPIVIHIPPAKAYKRAKSPSGEPPMRVAILCTALLGLLLFLLGLAVSMTRGRTGVVAGSPSDPADPLFRMIRAHGNTAEYAPMLAVLFLLVGERNPATWPLWVMGIAVLSRYLIAIGMIAGPTLAKPNPLRFVGALGTYVTGVALCVAAFMTA
jgi:uncharacterized membrane protein YecN with MAPEG domain